MFKRNVCVALTTLLFALAFTSNASAADKVRGSFGIGVGQGTTVSYGLSAKLYMGESFALQPVVGLGNDWIGVSVDALWEMPALVNLGFMEIAWAIGLGPGVGIGDNLAVGIAGVAGLEFNFSVIPGLPFDIVAEYRPSIFVLPGVDLDLVDFSGHLRIYF